MTVTVLTFTTRKPGITMAEFTEHGENYHVKVLQEVGGASFPTRHTRHYVQRTEGKAGAGELTNIKTPATMYMGKQETIDFDCVVEVEFDDEAHFQEFLTAITTEPGQTKVLEDEAKFMSTVRRTVVRLSHSETTTR